MSNIFSQRAFLVILAITFAIAIFLNIKLSKDTNDKAEIVSQLELDSHPVAELVELSPTESEVAEELQDGPKLMINAASVDEIAERLKGIGEKTAQLIVEHRDIYGAYQSFDELQAVKGIGPAKIEANRDIISFGPNQY